MAKTRSYLLNNFAKDYLLIFIPFLLIVSLVFLVQISILSSKINLETKELFIFFGYLIPEIFLYTIPFSLITALANLFARLSEENELIALFALGHSPLRLFRYLLPTLILISLLLLVLSLMFYPQMKQKINAFKEQKIAEATLKLSPNRLSQSFGNYHVYVASKDENGYKNIVLFDNHDLKQKSIFIAKRAEAKNDGTRLILTLKNGIGESFDNKRIKTLSYKRLYIFKYPKFSHKKALSYKEYWAEAKTKKGTRGKLLYFIFIALSPLLTLPFIASFTIFNPRYKKGNSALAIAISAVTIYLPAILLKKSGSIALFIGSIILIGFLGIYLFNRRVLRYF